jgi:DNA-binding NtrC family response regulator
VAWLEGELFGRGGAPGQLGPAHGGTLFLDEVNALPVELQGRLIHVLEVGESKLDARLVSASPRPLRREVERERFNAELMYRLRVIPLFIPPLRDRSGDIELLARDFVAQHNQTSVRQVARISPGAVTALASYVWPGNVRELDNAIRYAFVMGDGPVLTEGDLPPEVRGEEQGRPLPANIPPDTGQLPSEARRILRALERAGGNRERAAASLGMSRVTLWRKLKAFELEDTVRAGRRTHRH